MQTLGDRLREERERRGSLRAAARDLRVAPGTYEAWENGWRKPRGVDEFEKIEVFLEVERPVTLYWAGLLTEEDASRYLDSTRAMGVYASSAMSIAAA